MTERNDVRGFRTGRKNSLKIFIALLFALFFVLFCGNMTTVHAESKAKGQIVMSIEKATIGQGFIMEPQYVDFYEGDTLATITVRQLTKLGRRYNYDGRIQSGFYLSEISDPGRGAINVPDYIREIMQKKNLKLYEKDNTPEYLGEKDYCAQSGWVYDYNGVQPNVSSCDVQPTDGSVLQWKFTMVTYGLDVEGDTEYFSQNGLEKPDRVRLNKILAEVRKNSAVLNDPEVKNSYERCLKLTMNLRTSRTDLLADMNVLRKALSWNTIRDVEYYGNQQQECTVQNGTPEDKIPYISQAGIVLRATKNNGTVAFNPVWHCSEKYTPDVAGDYEFYPEIPDVYKLAEDEKLPKFTVHVRKLGDVNKDGQVTESDIEALLKNRYFGNEEEVSSDESEAVGDLNFDQKINMQDYSLLSGALSSSDIHTEDDGRIVLKFSQSDCKAGDKVMAALLLYSGSIDTVGINLNLAGVRDLSIECHQDFQMEYQKTDADKNRMFVMLGRRTKGALRAQSIQGISIATVSFTCTKDGDPALSFDNTGDVLSEGQSVLGYGNGNKVTFSTSANYGKDTRFLFQLNDGRVRTGQISDQEISEDGIYMKLVEVAFRASDAENTEQNHVRIRAQLPEGADLVIGRTLENGEIKDPLTLKENVYYAEGDVGCFVLGQSAQREECALYGILTDAAGNKTVYKFKIERKGYKKATCAYGSKTPLLIDGWNRENPEILSAKWNLEEAELKGWDENGDPTQLYVDMPVNDSSQKLYYKADTETTGTLYAKEAGEYWLEIKDSAGETRGKMRLVAQYPYEAADYYISRAKEISLDVGDYNASVSDQLFTYKDMIDKVQRIQTRYPQNLPLYLDGMGRYTVSETSQRATDEEGYELSADFLRTDVVNELRRGIAEIRPVLEKNKYVPPVEPTVKPDVTPDKKDVSFTGSNVISREFAKKSFNLGIRSDSNGKVTYASSNKKVATVSASGKITMKSMGSTVITVRTAETSSFKAGIRKITVNLTPKKTSLSSVKSSKKKTLTIRWKKAKNISGYQIQYATSKNFKGAKTVKASAKAISGTAKKLKSKKTYYVRIRTFKKAYGKTVYSGWSKVKKAKVK